MTLVPNSIRRKSACFVQGAKGEFIGICRPSRSGDLLIFAFGRVCLSPGTADLAEAGGRATSCFHLM